MLDKIFQNIEKLNGFEITNGETHKETKFKDIIQTVNLIQENINDITVLGLDMDSQALIARDKAADTISSRGALILNNWGDAEKALAMLQRARSICGTQVTTAQIDENIVTVNGIIDNKKKFGAPIKSAPTLHTINGCGTVLYGDTQYFVLLFIPILPLARFSVENVGEKSYKFFGRLKLHHWQQIWVYLLVAVIGFLIINYWIFILLLIWFVYLKISDKPLIQPTQSSGCISSTADHSRAEYYFNQGIYFSKTKQYEKALAAYNQAINNDDKDADTWNNKSFVLTKLGRYDEAIEAGKVALQLAPNDAEIKDTLQTALAARGEGREKNTRGNGRDFSELLWGMEGCALPRDYTNSKDSKIGNENTYRKYKPICDACKLNCILAQLKPPQ